MTATLKQYWFYNLYKFTKKVNGLIHFLQKLPVIGKIFSPTLFAQYGFKKIILVILMLGSAVLSIVMKFFWLGLYYVGGCLWLNSADPITYAFQFEPKAMIFGLLLWSVAVSLIMYNITNIYGDVEGNQKEYITQFHISRRNFLLQALFLDTAQQLIYYLPAFIVYAALAKNGLLLVLAPFLYAFGSLLGSWMSRVLYSIQSGKLIRWSYYIGAFIVGGTIAFVYRYLLLATTLGTVLFAAVPIAITLLSFYMIRHYPHENEYYLSISEKHIDFAGKIAAAKNKDQQYTSAGLAMQKKLTLSSDKDYTTLHGSAYLNALLFNRYRKILNDKLRLRLGIIAGVAVLLAIIGLLGFTSSFTQDKVINLLPLLFFVMYFSSLGKVIVQMVFVNCDVAMLYYPFYRERKTILSGFNYRLLRTFFYNGTISLALLVLFIVFNVTNQFFLDGQFFLVLILLLLGLTALFSFHELFIYYILQPFTGDMQVVNPLYRLVSGGLYWISYINTQLKTTGIHYVIIVSIACLIYAAIGYFVIIKKAPSTFRIKS